MRVRERASGGGAASGSEWSKQCSTNARPAVALRVHFSKAEEEAAAEAEAHLNLIVVTVTAACVHERHKGQKDESPLKRLG